jgi:hypothetical protein
MYTYDQSQSVPTTDVHRSADSFRLQNWVTTCIITVSGNHNNSSLSAWRHLQQVRLWNYIGLRVTNLAACEMRRSLRRNITEMQCAPKNSLGMHLACCCYSVTSHVQYSQLCQFYIDLSSQLKVSASSIGVALNERQVLCKRDLKLSPFPKHVSDHFMMACTRCWWTCRIFVPYYLFWNITRINRSPWHIYSRMYSRR